MTNSQPRFLMMGLPESGKTTYLAAIYHTLNAAGDGELGLREPPEEREYLLGIERQWLALEPIGHSAHVGPKRVELPIRDPSGQALDLEIPDVNGEEYQDAWE